MDAEINDQLKQEKTAKRNFATAQEDEVTRQIDEVTNAAPMNISLYKQYLEWFTQFELERIKPTEIVIEAKFGGKDSVPQMQSNNTTKAESSKPHAFH